MTPVSMALRRMMKLSWLRSAPWAGKDNQVNLMSQYQVQGCWGDSWDFVPLHRSYSVSVQYPWWQMSDIPQQQTCGQIHGLLLVAVGTDIIISCILMIPSTRSKRFIERFIEFFAMPRHSPVDFISGPRLMSAPSSYSKENTILMAI